MLTNKNIQNIYTLSPLQQGIYFQWLYNKFSLNYFEQMSYRVLADIDPLAVEQALTDLFNRYDILRTVFNHERTDHILQVVLKERSPHFEYLDIRDVAEDKEDYIVEYTVKDRQNGFDLNNDVLMRVMLLRVKDNEYHFIWSHHHILMDGWCASILTAEFFYLYSCCVNKRAHSLPFVKQYRHYIEWLDSRNKADAIDYWTNYLDRYTQKASIHPTINRYGSEEGYLTCFTEKKLPKKLSWGLREHAAQNHVTLNNYVQSLWGILLSKYNNTNDVVFGSIVSGRPAEIVGIEEMIGLFINTIPIRVTYQSGEKFQTLLKRVHEKAIESETYHYSPLNVIHGLNPLKNNLFDQILAFESFPIAKNIEENGSQMVTATAEGESGIKDINTFRQTNYNFNITFIPHEDIALRFDYNGYLYDKQFVEHIFNHFEYLAEQVLQDENIAIDELQLLRKGEADDINALYNNGPQPYPSDKTIVEIFEEQVLLHASLPAVCFQNKNISYSELNEKANRLAKILIKNGAARDKIVGIIAERSCEMIIGVLAILKAGSAYLPIDPDYPRERIIHMLKDSGAVALLKYRYNGSLAELNIPEVNIPDMKEIQGDKDNISLIVKPDDLAYVIYTSGSSGLPKGVMVEHHSFLNINAAYFNIQPGENTVLTCNFVFDVSVLEIFSSLLRGACLHIPELSLTSDPADYANYLFSRQISTAYLHPMYLQHISEVLKGFNTCYLKHILIGVEPIKRETIGWYLRQNIKIINGYGPTEATICATFYDVNSADNIPGLLPIGKPVQNNKVFILNDRMEFVPAGTKGDIYIGGAGLARGYINNPELTGSVFVNHNNGVERIYRTGDSGRWLSDGNLEFYGRKDNQIKINGYRIELGEIEMQLTKHHAIAEAAVIMNETEKSGLSAFIVMQEQISLYEIREFLSKSLPRYMFPSRFVVLSKLPLTTNGKINRKALVTIEGKEMMSGVEYVKPRNHLEEKLVDAFASILGMERLGIRENFFEIGGDSIKAIQISSRLHKDGYRLRVKDVFKFPTIETLSAMVKKTSREIDQSLIEGEIPLTSVQHDFFLSNRTFPNHYNQSVMLYAAGGFEEEMVRKLFEFIQNHHDALRINFSKEGEKIIQFNKKQQNVSLTVENLSLENFSEELIFHSETLHKSIDVENGPLMKLGLFHSDNGDRLLIVIHHLVIDGVSWRVLFEDIGTLYKQYKEGEKLSLPAKTDSFKRWAVKLSEYANSHEFLKEKKYWEAIEKIQVDKLEKTRIPDEAIIKNTEIIRFRLSKEETKVLITGANRAYSTEINDLLLVAFGIAMRTIFKSEKVMIALEGHGREELMHDMDISRTVGWFTSLFPVVLNMEYKDDLSRQIREVKENLHQLPNKGIGYWLLKYLTNPLEKSNLKFDQSPEIAFNYLGQFDADVNNMEFQVVEDVAIKQRDKQASPYILDVSGRIVNYELEILIEYDNKQLDVLKMEQLSASYKETLKMVIAHCTSKNEKEITPSDFIYSEMSIEDLDTLFN